MPTGTPAASSKLRRRIPALIAADFCDLVIFFLGADFFARAFDLAFAFAMCLISKVQIFFFAFGFSKKLPPDVFNNQMSAGYTTRSGRAIKATQQFTIIEDDEEERRVREEEKAWERGQIVDNDLDCAPKVPKTKCERKCTLSVDADECKHAPCDCECHNEDCGCTEACDLDECECECHDDDDGLDEFFTEEYEEEVDVEEEEGVEEEYDEEETDEDLSVDEEELCESDEVCDCTPSAEAKHCRLTRRHKDKELCTCDCHDIGDDDDDDDDVELSARKRPRIESSSEDDFSTPPNDVAEE